MQRCGHYPQGLALLDMEMRVGGDIIGALIDFSQGTGHPVVVQFHYPYQ